MPNLDRLAADGVRFAQCHTSHTVCSQSRAAFMTGWPTHVTGHRSLWSLLRSYEPNVLRYLEEAGYDVQWYGKNDNMDNISIAASTDYRTGGSGTEYGSNPYEEGDPAFYSFLWTALDESKVNSTTDANNVDSAITFLEERAAAAAKAKINGEEDDQDPFMIFLPLTYVRGIAQRQHSTNASANSPVAQYASLTATTTTAAQVPPPAVLVPRAVLLDDRSGQRDPAARHPGGERRQARLPRGPP